MKKQQIIEELKNLGASYDPKDGKTELKELLELERKKQPLPKHEQVILFSYEPDIENRMNTIRKGRERLQMLLDEFTALGLFPISDIKELISIARSGANFVKQRISETIPEADLPKVGGFRVKRENVIDSLDLPDFGKLNSMAISCKPHLQDAGCYNLTDGKITIADDVEEIVKGNYSLSAKTQLQVEAHQAHQEARQALEKMHKLFRLAFRNEKVLKNQHSLALNRFFKFDEGTQKLKIKDDFYRGALR